MQKCDVLIIGGGAAGSMAAISAARAGADVIVIERGGCLGGMWTAGLIGITLDPDNKCALLDEFLALVETEQQKGNATIFESQKYILEQLCVDAGAKLMYHTQVYDIEMQGRRIDTVSVISKSGKTIIQPKIVIDATGDGDIAAMAGCGFDVGRPEDSKTQPMSMLSLVTGIDAIKADEYISDQNKTFWQARNRLKELFAECGLSASLGCASIVPLIKDIYIFSINQEYGKSGRDVNELTEATLAARKEVYETVAALKAKCPDIFSDLTLIATPECIGVREGRRIHGKYTVTLDDMLTGRRHDDAICTVTYWPDIHSPEKDDKGFTDGGLTIHPYDIPFRSLLPVDADDLIVAGRCISGDFYAHSSYRVMGNMAAVGDAAGKMAAKAVKENKALSDITYKK